MKLLFPHKKPYWLFIFFLIVCIIIIPKNKNFLNGVIFSTYDEISTYDLGFSSVRNFFGDEFLDFDTNFSALLRASKIIPNSLFGVERKKEIPKLYLEIKF